MSFRRESYSVLRIGSILNSSIKVDSQPVLYLNQQYPVKFVKIYGIITDKTIDDTINPTTGRTDYLFKVDDGTGSLWVRSSNSEAETLKKWDFIRVIGYTSLDTSNGKDYEVTIVSKAALKVNEKDWELVHILESVKNSPKIGKKITTKPKVTSSVDDESISSNLENTDEIIEESESEENEPAMESLTQKIERILRESDSGNGVEFSEILKMLGSAHESEVDDILFELAYEGKVYQPRPDFCSAGADRRRCAVGY